MCSLFCNRDPVKVKYIQSAIMSAVNYIQTTKACKKSLKITKGQSIRISKKTRQHNGQKNKQRSTKHTYKTKDRVTRTPLKPGVYSGNLCESLK